LAHSHDILERLPNFIIMRKILVFCVAIFISLSSFAKEIQIDQARKVATAFLQHSSGADLKSSSTLELSLVEGIFDTELRDLYVFNINKSEGFIIVSGDDAAVPILAYSNTNSISASIVPDNVRSWLENYQHQIQYIRENNIEQTSEIKYYWDNGIPRNLKSTQNSVAPLLTTKWNQAPYYNAKCPYDHDKGKLTYSGCVPTAFAQIMKYWEYPSKGVGFNSYEDNFEEYGMFGTLYANFGKTNYDWEAMPDAVNRPNDAVATLMYHVGVAFEAMYGINGTGVILNYDSISENKTDNIKPELLLPKFFNYSTSMQAIYRLYFSDNEWADILKLELDAGRPIGYGGNNSDFSGGHAFVCDGYDENDFFHLNWGWGGSGNGFFIISDLSIGQNDYNYTNHAYIGIQPSDSADLLKLKLNSNVVTNKSTIAYEEGFIINADIINEGTSSFSGDLAAAVFDDHYTLIDFVEISNGQNLNSGENYSEGISFTTPGLPSLIPGSYRVYVLYRQDNEEWLALQSDSLNSATIDYIDIDVVSRSKIRLISMMNLSSNEIIPGDSLSVNLNITNDSIADFNGSFNLSVYSLNGELAGSIEEKTNMSLNARSHFDDNITFSTSNIELDPGTYLLKLQHRWENSDYRLTGSTATFINPIILNIQEPPLEKDPYEDNNSPLQIFKLPINWIDDIAMVKTEDSNIHMDNDRDFYSIDLNPDYVYSINARLHDEQSSNDGQEYTVDALFLYSLDGVTPSDRYDLMLPSPLSVSELDIIYFIAAGYYNVGCTGTYSLEINLSRTLVSAIETIENPQEIFVFPNPFQEKITISGTNDIQRYQLFDNHGRLLRDKTVNDRKLLIDFSTLQQGSYYLKIISENKTLTRRIIKN